MLPSSHKWLFTLPLALMVFGPSHAESRPESRVAIKSTAYFEFYSDFSMNLHDALLKNGRIRGSGNPELFSKGEQLRCFEQLAKEEQMGWDLAVTYYAGNISRGSHDDRHQMLPRLALLYGGTDWAKSIEQRISAVTNGLRSAAAPAYRQCYWHVQDALNRTWIENVAGLLSQFEESVAERLFEKYQKSWSATPIPVDVVETVSWAGANTIVLNPPPGHITISSTSDLNQGLAALEIVFHEASHLLALYPSPLQDALSTSQATHGKTDSPLWHASLFYITGEIVRSIYADELGRVYRPYVIQNEIYSPAFLESLGAAWDPYISGERSLADATDTLVQLTSKGQESNGVVLKK